MHLFLGFYVNSPSNPCYQSLTMFDMYIPVADVSNLNNCKDRINIAPCLTPSRKTFKFTTHIMIQLSHSFLGYPGNYNSRTLGKTRKVQRLEKGNNTMHQAGFLKAKEFWIIERNLKHCRIRLKSSMFSRN
jgi:hypothetical protein